MTLKEPERDILIVHNRKKSQEAIEQVAWLIDNQQWHLAMNRIYYGKSVRKAYENRMEGDYNVLSEFTEEIVKQAFTEMQEAITAIEKLLD